MKVSFVDCDCFPLSGGGDGEGHRQSEQGWRCVYDAGRLNLTQGNLQLSYFYVSDDAASMDGNQKFCKTMCNRVVSSGSRIGLQG